MVTGWGSPNGANLINALAGSATPSFTLSDSPSSLTITQGGSAGTSTITVNDQGGFTGSVTLAASGFAQRCNRSVRYEPNNRDQYTFTDGERHSYYRNVHGDHHRHIREPGRNHHPCPNGQCRSGAKLHHRHLARFRDRNPGQQRNQHHHHHQPEQLQFCNHAYRYRLAQWRDGGVLHQPRDSSSERQCDLNPHANRFRHGNHRSCHGDDHRNFGLAHSQHHHCPHSQCFWGYGKLHYRRLAFFSDHRSERQRVDHPHHHQPEWFPFCS